MATNEALRASTVGLSMENYLAGKAPPKAIYFSWAAACRKILMVDNLRNRWKILKIGPIFLRKMVNWWIIAFTSAPSQGT